MTNKELQDIEMELLVDAIQQYLVLELSHYLWFQTEGIWAD